MIHWWKILSFENEFGKGRDIRSGPPVDFFTLFTHVTSLTDFGHFSQNADSNVTYLVGSCYIFPSMCTNIRRSQCPVNLSKNYAHSQNVCNRYLYNSIQLY